MKTREQRLHATPPLEIIICVLVGYSAVLSECILGFIEDSNSLVEAATLSITIRFFLQSKVSFIFIAPAHQEALSL